MLAHLPAGLCHDRLQELGPPGQLLQRRQLALEAQCGAHGPALLLVRRRIPLSPEDVGRMELAQRPQQLVRILDASQRCLIADEAQPAVGEVDAGGDQLPQSPPARGGEPLGVGRHRPHQRPQYPLDGVAQVTRHRGVQALQRPRPLPTRRTFDEPERIGDLEANDRREGQRLRAQAGQWAAQGELGPLRTLADDDDLLLRIAPRRRSERLIEHSRPGWVEVGAALGIAQTPLEAVHAQRSGQDGMLQLPGEGECDHLADQLDVVLDLAAQAPGRRRHPLLRHPRLRRRRRPCIRSGVVHLCPCSASHRTRRASWARSAQ